MAVEAGTTAERLQDGPVRLRRAMPADATFLAELALHPAIDPFLGGGIPRDPLEACAQIEEGLADSRRRGVWVVEADAGEGARDAGGLAFETTNAHSAIANVSGVMVHPDFRGRRVAGGAARLLARHLIEDLGFHRVQLECYGFNAVALRVFERAGFTREGVRRAAYWRHGAWNDGVLFGLVAEDLERR